MVPEWDPAKARANLRKHGVRFADAVTALEDERAISVRDEREDEERWTTIGMDPLARVLVVVYTWRGDQIRLISARLATPRRAVNTRGSMKREYDFSKGRRGAVLRVPPEKTRVTIRLDNDVLDWFRQQVDDAGGGNYQTLINEALRTFMRQKQESLETILRRVIRDELRQAG
jgi:uncharacterized DUF497 family protein